MYDRTDLNNIYYIPEAGNSTRAFDGKYIYHAIPDKELKEALEGFMRINGLDGLGTLGWKWLKRLKKKVRRGFRKVGKFVKKAGRKIKVVAKKVGKAVYKGVRVALPIVAVAANFIPIPGLAQAVSAGAALASAGIEALEARKKRKREEKQAKEEAKRMQLEEEKIRKEEEKVLREEKERVRKELERQYGLKLKSVSPTTPVGKSNLLNPVKSREITYIPPVKRAKRKQAVGLNTTMQNLAKPINSYINNRPMVQAQQAMHQAMHRPMVQAQQAMVQQQQQAIYQPMIQQQQLNNFITAKTANNNKMSDISALTRLTMQSQTADIINALK